MYHKIQLYIYVYATSDTCINLEEGKNQNEEKTLVHHRHLANVNKKMGPSQYNFRFYFALEHFLFFGRQ